MLDRFSLDVGGWMVEYLVGFKRWIVQAKDGTKLVVLMVCWMVD